MFAFLTKLLLVARSRLKSRASLEAENLVLRQQVIVLSRKSRSRMRQLYAKVSSRRGFFTISVCNSFEPIPTARKRGTSTSKICA
jgi:hypothetical protein